MLVALNLPSEPITHITEKCGGIVVEISDSELRGPGATPCSVLEQAD